MFRHTLNAPATLTDFATRVLWARSLATAPKPVLARLCRQCGAWVANSLRPLCQAALVSHLFLKIRQGSKKSVSSEVCLVTACTSVDTSTIASPDLTVSQNIKVLACLTLWSRPMAKFGFMLLRTHKTVATKNNSLVMFQIMTFHLLHGVSENLRRGIKTDTSHLLLNQ